jgi:general secretion pathway protein G
MSDSNDFQNSLSQEKDMTAIRRTSQYTKRGFTLVEILIVVIILGILAAIVIPQFTNASTEARQSNLRSQLQTLRSQISLYKLQHRDEAPELVANGWDQMTGCTNIDGVVNPGADPAARDEANGYIYGPYYQTPPTNPLSNSSTCAAAAAAGVGWVYIEATGVVSATEGDGSTAFTE